MLRKALAGLALLVALSGCGKNFTVEGRGGIDTQLDRASTVLEDRGYNISKRSSNQENNSSRGYLFGTKSIPLGFFCSTSQKTEIEITPKDTDTYKYRVRSERTDAEFLKLAFPEEDEMEEILIAERIVEANSTTGVKKPRYSPWSHYFLTDLGAESLRILISSTSKDKE